MLLLGPNMNPVAVINGERDKVAAVAAALLLHSCLLYGLWHFQFTPPLAESLPVFVSLVSLTAPATRAAPVAVKPVQPTRKNQEAPGVSPVVSQPLANPAPLVAPVEQVAPQPPVARALTTHAPVMAPVGARPANVPVVTSAADAPESVIRSSELSVSCPERTPPVYPKQSLRLGEQGKTVLLVELDELGRVSSVAVNTKSGFPRLDEAAINAVNTWRCTPAKRNGVAVRSVAMQPFNFTLKGR
jgi:protein TonB